MNIDCGLLCERYLDVIYRDMQIQDINVIKSERITESYGEVLYDSIEKLLTHVVLSSEDVFVDLGSGLGKVVLHIFLNSNVKRAYGIEILSHLHQRAQLAAQRIQRELPDFFMEGRKLKFLLGDFLKLPFKDATVIFINSICFSQRILTELEFIINNTPSVHTLLTMRPFHGLTKLSFKKAIRVECSWDSALCYLYST